MQVTGLAMDVPTGHPLALDNLPFEWLANTVSRDFNEMIIKVVDPFLEAEEGLLEGDGQIHKEVVAHTFELVVLLLLDGENQVALNHVGDLLCFSLENDLIAILHAFLNFYL